MKKIVLFIFISILLTLKIHGQEASWTDFDTLEIFNDRILVDFVSYYDSNITQQGQAFLYPDSLELRKSKWLPRFFTAIILADSMVLHGTVKSHGKDEKYRIGKYKNGEKIEMIYFDSGGNQISRQEFYGGLRSHGDQEQGTNLYIIHGTKEERK